MPNRRDFLRNAAGATAAALMSRHGLAGAGLPPRQVGAPPGKRREVSIGGRRVKTVDVHAHCFVPEVMNLVKDTPPAAFRRKSRRFGMCLLLAAQPGRWSGDYTAVQRRWRAPGIRGAEWQRRRVSGAIHPRSASVLARRRSPAPTRRGAAAGTPRRDRPRCGCPGTVRPLDRSMPAEPHSARV